MILRGDYLFFPRNSPYCLTWNLAFLYFHACSLKRFLSSTIIPCSPVENFPVFQIPSPHLSAFPTSTPILISQPFSPILILSFEALPDFCLFPFATPGLARRFLSLSLSLGQMGLAAKRADLKSRVVKFHKDLLENAGSTCSNVWEQGKCPNLQGSYVLGSNVQSDT